MSCARTRVNFFWVWSPQIQIFQAPVTPQSRYSRGWSNIRFFLYLYMHMYMHMYMCM